MLDGNRVGLRGLKVVIAALRSWRHNKPAAVAEVSVDDNLQA
nr:hypothetical protein [Mycobacterium lepromatosis]